jgi:hypothetical protein
VETHVIPRRSRWRTPEELEAAAARSTAEGESTPDRSRWLRSYVLAETSREFGGRFRLGFTPAAHPLPNRPNTTVDASGRSGSKWTRQGYD